MGLIKTKHFQYTGVDDYDVALDTQINEFINEIGLGSDDLISIKYSAYASEGVNYHSALVVYANK